MQIELTEEIEGGLSAIAVITGQTIDKIISRLVETEVMRLNRDALLLAERDAADAAAVAHILHKLITCRRRSRTDNAEVIKAWREQEPELRGRPNSKISEKLRLLGLRVGGRFTHESRGQGYVYKRILEGGHVIFVRS